MEALILYFVLFFPGIYGMPFPDSQLQSIPFSTLRELSRTLTYTIPSLALLWYLISDKNGFSALKDIKPGRSDLLPLAIGLPGLIIIGLLVSLMVSLFSGPSPPPLIEAPLTIPGTFVMIFACLGTGYLEETYFRYYLLTRLRRLLPQPAKRIMLSVILFSMCHIYEGPWGVLNAAIAGILLSVLFIHRRSLHGIAWAHSAYNIFVYSMGIFGS